MSNIERRAFVKGAALGTLAFTVGGVTQMLTTGQARAAGVPFRMLKAPEAETIEALGETLVPGAREAGSFYAVPDYIRAARAGAEAGAREAGSCGGQADKCRDA